MKTLKAPGLSPYRFVSGGMVRLVCACQRRPCHSGAYAASMQEAHEGACNRELTSSGGLSPCECKNVGTLSRTVHAGLNTELGATHLIDNAKLNPSIAGRS